MLFFKLTDEQNATRHGRIVSSDKSNNINCIKQNNILYVLTTYVFILYYFTKLTAIGYSSSVLTTGTSDGVDPEV